MTKKLVAKVNDEVSGFIQEAIKNSLPVETMERLFALREKVKAETAKEAYHNAIAKFQSVCPEVQKTKKVMNKDGQSVRYQYAPLDEIIKQIKKPLADNGLSYSWDVTNADGLITATVKVTHMLGYSETSSFQVPVDKEGFMTAPQKYASALTFAKRYTLTNALGISTGEDDTDATDVGKEANVKSTKSKIVFLLRTLEQETGSVEKIKTAVKKLTKIELGDSVDYGEIVSRLEVLVQERQNDQSKV